MTNEHLKAGKKLLIKQEAVSTGLFVNYRTFTHTAPTQFDINSAMPDSVASISANGVILPNGQVVHISNVADLSAC